VGVEWLWLEEKGRFHVVKNAPLFVPGLAAGDEIELCDRSPDGQVSNWELVRPSKRSVIWIADLGGSQLEKILTEFREIGCNTAMLSQFSHGAIDVPPEVTQNQVDAILDNLEEQDYAIAFPCDRQIS
jgi:hypothetical protein